MRDRGVGVYWLLLVPLWLGALDVGWNLIGAKQDINATLFTRDYIQGVWSYRKGEWRYFGPKKSGCKLLREIKAGEGFWVLSSQKHPDAFWLERGVSWYWQLQGELNMSIRARVYDVDLFDTSKEQIATLHQRDRVVICYFSAGTYEEWREDSSLFDSSILGEPLKGWKGEYWLDIRSQKVRDIMKKRLDLAKKKGCDGVEPDNVDGYLHTSGFSIGYKDQIAYNRFLAQEAHKRGLLVGLKNDLEQIKDLVDFFDFAVNEECFRYRECGKYLPFLTQNKAVLNAEYSGVLDCQKAKLYGISAALYNRELDGKLYRSCK